MEKGYEELNIFNKTISRRGFL
ncbi:hypothetical protein LCGC14_1819050, partial [marine sediment metagenome]